MRRFFPIWLVVVFITVSVIGGCVFAFSRFVAEGPLPSQKEVYIPKGIGLKRIAYLLKREKIISNAPLFILGVQMSGNTKNIKAGEYSFPKGVSAKKTMLILVSGQTYIRRFNVPEGLSSYQIVALMNNAKGLFGTVEKLPADGTLLPDTYYYSYGDTKQNMIARMRNAMARFLSECWEKRAPDLPLKTPWEAVVLASMVEKETALDTERPEVAAVFINRLQKEMKLQSDPTVLYGLTNGRYDLKRSLTLNDLKTPNPYNTYYVQSLPRGAVCNPGKASIKAVVNPAKTPNLYFVANGSGGHSFSPSYDEHQKNVKFWRNMNRQKSH